MNEMHWLKLHTAFILSFLLYTSLYICLFNPEYYSACLDVQLLNFSTYDKSVVTVPDPWLFQNGISYTF